MIDKRERDIVRLIKSEGDISSKDLFDKFDWDVSYATLKRILKKLIEMNFLTSSGKGKSTKYTISPTYEIFQPIVLEKYFENEIDERQINEQFNSDIITGLLADNDLFTKSEFEKLEYLHNKYKTNISSLTEFEYNNELERLAIDLSWKSSQIEGNTYSLLETEFLLKEKQTAKGKTKDEATMLLNHKDAIDFILQNPDYLSTINLAKIENIHSILIKELGVNRNLRKRRVGITGTNYRPLDNEFQIKEALELSCNLINSKKIFFEKALLALLLISYIQPFADGNKRTARIVSNSILINHGSCPISYRTVDSVEYKEAMLVFYEQNNLYNVKRIFIEQFEFAVNTYF